MASSLDAGLRRKVSWLLNLEGDFNAQVDDGIAKIKALGLSVADTNAQIKAYKEQRAAAAEVEKVSSQNLLGSVAAMGLVIAGFERGKAAVEEWIDSTVKANDRLEKMGISTGAAGDSIHRYSQSVDALTTSFDQLFVKLSGPGFDRLTQTVALLERLAQYAGTDAQHPILGNNPGGLFGLSTSAPLYVASMGTLPALQSAYTNTTNNLPKLMDWLGYPQTSTPVGQINAPDFGPFYDTLQYPNDFGPTPAQLTGVLAARSKKDLAWKGYQALVTKLPGVAAQTDPAFLDYMNGTLPFGGGANFAGSSAGGPLLDQSTMAAMAAAASTLGAPPRTPHPVTAQGFASVLGGFGGGLASGLSALGPAGMAVGAVAGLAPHLGQTFDSLFSQADHLPAQLMRGLDHIIDRLPDIFTRLLPDLIYGLAQLIPNLVDALVIKLPVALAKAIHDAFLGGTGAGASAAARSYFGRQGGRGLRGNDATQYLEDQAFFSSAGGAGLARTRDVHIHTHGSVPDQIRAIKKALGSYGNGYDLTPPVTH